MRIFNLRAKGFIGIKKGMGIDEIDLDLSHLSGLVALAGKNGAGKSTCMELLSPYRMLSSRKKSLNHHVFRRDSEKDLSFEYNGDFYQTLLKIDSDSDRSEGFIWRNGKSEVDGKVSSYDRYITDLLGSPALFFNSVFCAQNADQISDMTTGDAKKLFSEFLRLDRLVAWENTCKQCCAIITGREDRTAREIEKIGAEIAEKTRAVAGIDPLREDIRALETQLNSASKKLAGMRKDETRLQEAAAEAQFSADKLATLQGERSRLVLEINDALSRDAQDVQAAKAVSETFLRKRAELSALLANEKPIMDAAARLSQLEMDLPTEERERANVLDCKSRIAASIIDTRSKYTELKRQAATLETDAGIQRVIQEIANCEARLTDLCRKDPDCKSQTCSFIVSALQAEKRIPELQKALDCRQREVSAQLETLRAEITGLGKTGMALKTQLDPLSKRDFELQERIDRLRADFQAAKKLAGQLPELRAAQAALEGLEAQLIEKNEAGMKARADAAENLRRLRERKDGYDSAIAELSLSLNTEAPDMLSQLRQDIVLADNTIKALSGQIAQKKANLARLEADAETLAGLKAKASGLQDLKKTASDEMAEWTYLKNACGKDGLRALEIDSVAPAISGYANDLLHGTFGPGYSVKLQTQDPETGREILDILAIREDGSEVLLDNLSGGEKVWSLKALRLAMTLITQEKSGRRYETLLCDEEDGALSDENAINFIQLYRSLMKVAGMSTCFYISHKPECVAMADHVLRFGKGGVKLG